MRLLFDIFLINQKMNDQVSDPTAQAFEAVTRGEYEVTVDVIVFFFQV